MTITIRIDRRFVVVLSAIVIGLLILVLPGKTNASPQLAATPCPPPPEPQATGAAIQWYERGFMVWIKATGSLYVLYDPSGQHMSGTIEVYQDTWKEGMPETDPGIVPPEGKFQPTRGGGLLWRTNPKVRAGLGWGIDSPHGYTALFEQRGNKMWFNGLTFDVFTVTENTWVKSGIWW